jgi:hypothetical protein
VKGEATDAFNVCILTGNLLENRKLYISPLSIGGLRIEKEKR